jgi:hypothetical protein
MTDALRSGVRSFAAEVITAYRVQAARSGWLVIWSPWRRTFTAFAVFAPEPVVIDEATVELLVNRMHLAESWYAAPAAHR